MKNKWVKYFTILGVCLFIASIIYMAFTYENVGGADEKIGTVVEEYAKAAGVEEREPYINTDKGDLLLFLFCFSGIVAGFYLGYNWKKIISERPMIQEIDIPKANKINIDRMG